MEKIIFKNLTKDISDSLIWDLAYNLCIPAFYEYAIRAKTKVIPKNNFSKLHKHLSSAGISLPSIHILKSQPINQLRKEASKLTLVHPKVYNAPVRALTSVFNSQKINKLLLQERLGLKIEHIVSDLNKKKFTFTNDESQLASRELSALKASFLFLNWFYVKPTYLRPNVNSLSFICLPRDVTEYNKGGASALIKKKSISKNQPFIKLKLENKKLGSDFLTLYSNQLRLFLRSLSSEKINTILRLYKLIYDINIVDNATIDKLPIFILLNKRNYPMYKTIERLYKLGYTRMIHLKFLNEECIKLILNEKLTKALKG